MRLLFVHQNFPGQYLRLAAHLAAQSGNEVVGVGEAGNLAQRREDAPGVTLRGYEVPAAPSAAPHLDRQNEAWLRGTAVASGLLEMKRAGYRPDLICAHGGWGEAGFIKDVFPDSPLLLYCEYFYTGVDLAFDPATFRDSIEDRFRLRWWNAPQLLALDAADRGITPTQWQRRQFPEVYQPRISVIHEGIDTDALAPVLDGREEELVTYIAPNLEPYRGFHVFMRALPELQKRRPKARVVIVGGDASVYSPPLPGGETWRKRMLRELDGRIDLARVQFIGSLPYGDYVGLLRRSTVHVYLSYPFVLSWSLLEAMSLGCLVVGSRTPPVEEVIRHGENGLLADFLSPERIAEEIDCAIGQQCDLRPVREAAHRTVRERYDFRRVCLPAQLALHAELLEKSR